MITSLHESLIKKEFSCVELAKKYLESIKKSELNAYITVTEDIAIESAKRTDYKIKNSCDIGMVEGIPMSLKDVISTKGIRTTCGSKMLANYEPIYDASCWEFLKELGVILLGKTNQDEFAMGSSNETSFFGPVKNPYNLAKVPGGSSGGSAASVAGNLAVFSIGSDTGGSVRQPSSFCGVVGLKPTYGAISRYGLIPLACSLDQIGIISQNAEDASIIFDIISRHDRKDATSSDLPRAKTFESLKKDVKGIRIGVPKNCFEGCDEEIKSAISKAIEVYESLGAKFDYFEFQELDLTMPVYYIICCAEASSNLGRFDGIRYGFRAEKFESVNDFIAKTRSEGFGDEVKRRILLGTYVLSSSYRDSFYNKAQEIRRIIKNSFNKKFEKYDLILTPTTPTTAFDFDYAHEDPVKMYLADVCTVPANIAGIPAISIPCGFSSNNLPIGMQLMAPHWHEDLLLNMTYKYETAS
ncbi:MAG: Asp-tRNA(Asn)/Glu-tRNA(Gln) amidotransferase subunit GatA [Oscillospiraceae bacterium]|nr:Asp-tRNA(Asn)/Glu-tRNA(Gln) amidotransferase subunit GatA [Oscillospiraceae bacterium]